MKRVIDKIERDNKAAIKRMKAKRNSNTNYDSYLNSIGEQYPIKDKNGQTQKRS